MIPDSSVDALLPVDREWLRAHGWVEPPPRPRWVDGELVVECRECGEDVPVEYVELMTFSSTAPVRYLTAEGEALRLHEPWCASRAGSAAL